MPILRFLLLIVCLFWQFNSYAKDYYVDIIAAPELKSLLEKHLDFYTRSKSITQNKNNQEANKEINSTSNSDSNSNSTIVNEKKSPVSLADNSAPNTPTASDAKEKNTTDLGYANQQELNEIQFEYLLESMSNQAKKILETEGYFNAKIFVSQQLKERQMYQIDVQAGERSKISQVNIRLEGEIKEAHDYHAWQTKISQAWLLPSGSHFHQELWSSGKNRLLQLLQSEQYLLAKIVGSKIDIYQQENRAEITLVIDSGPALKFGDFVINGLQRYSARVITNQANFQKGDPYSLNSLFDLQNRLAQDSHFKQVVVKVDQQAIKEQHIPINISLVELEKNKIDLGLKYDNVDGVGGRLAYDYLDLFTRGYIASIVLEAAKTIQSVNFGLAFPRNAKGNLYNINFAVKHSDIQQVQAVSESVNFLATRYIYDIETNLSLEFLNESNKLPSQQYDFTSLYLSLGMLWRNVDSLTHPKNGLVISGKVSSSLANLQNFPLINKAKINLSGSSFQRAYFRTNAYWTPADLIGTLVFRGEIGKLWANKDDYMPNSLSFRAGGANSLRGYDNFSLGSYSEIEQIIIGGRYLAITNLEYLYPINDRLSFATFFDYGNASRSRSDYQPVYGYGIGLRWFSPIAPVAFDLAYGDKNKSLHWYLSLAYNF